MKKFVIGASLLAFVAVSGVASAQGPVKVKSWDDLSWWGAPATPAPVKDSQGRSGYWWWPAAPDSGDDSSLWGNRGVVYSNFTPAPEVPPAPPEPKDDSAKVSRQIPVLNNVLFDFDKSTLKAEGKLEVDRVVGELKAHPKDSTVVVGHTCNVGDAAYNMGLGERRANAVKKYMVEAGIDASRVTTASKGEEAPAVSNDTPASRKLNRRAVFEYSVVD